jgi:hypothetical protein
MSAPGSGPAFVRIRDVMDRALRELAIGEGDLRERVVLASRVLLDGVTLHDFREREERALFSRVQLGLMEMAWMSLPGRSGEIDDDVVCAMATDLVDLHEAVEGRAIRETADHWAGKGPNSGR